MKIKYFIIAFIFLIGMPFAFGQSIGVSGDKAITAEINKEMVTDFSVSQGSTNPEKINIEEDYDWLDISEKDFVLGPRTEKSVKININIKKPGKYDASIKVCAREINDEGGVLSATACARHRLSVTAYGDSDYLRIIIYGVCVVIFVFAAEFFVKYLKRRKR